MAKTRVLAIVSVLITAGVVDCSGSASRTGVELPLPLKTLHRLPAGVFYLLAGRPNAYSANIWELTSSGQEVQLTHNRVGFGISWLSASRAGVVMADASNGVDELARLTAHGAQWLPAGQVSQGEFNRS